MIYGINLKIDVTKINKEKLFKGSKGTYLDATVFFDTDNVDKYGYNGGIQQQTDKEEENIYLGNCKKFYEKGDETTPVKKIGSVIDSDVPDNAFDDSDIPF